MGARRSRRAMEGAEAWSKPSGYCILTWDMSRPAKDVNRVRIKGRILRV